MLNLICNNNPVISKLIWNRIFSYISININITHKYYVRYSKRVQINTNKQLCIASIETSCLFTFVTCFFSLYSNTLNTQRNLLIHSTVSGALLCFTFTAYGVGYYIRGRLGIIRTATVEWADIRLPTVFYYFSRSK